MNNFFNYHHIICTEAMLNESEQKYQRLVENAMFGVFIFDMDKIYFCNKYIEENLGYKLEDFWKNNLTIWDLMPVDYRERLYPTAYNYFKNQTPYSDRFVSKLTCKSGQTKTFEIAVSSINYDGKYALQGNLIDITHFIEIQKKIESNMDILEKLEKRQRSLLENLQDGFVFVNTGFKIIQINQAFARMLEYEIEELEGKCLLELAAYEKDTISLLNGMKKRLKNINDSYELSLRSKSGKIIPTHISPTPFIDNGQIIGCFAIVKDLTKIKETEYRLTSQANILSNLSEGIIVTDEKGALIYMNKGAQQILNIDSEKFLNQNIDELTKLYNLEIDYRKIEKAVLKNQTWQTEAELTDNEGQQKYVRLSITPVKDYYNNLRNITIVISDLTEIIKAKKQAEAANLAKTNFLANISHDIRTPMIGILGAVDLLCQEKLSPYQTELIQTIKQCGEQMHELINDILDLSRIEAGYSLGTKKYFNLNQILNECVQTIYGKLPAEVELYTYVAPDVPLNLYGDQLQIRRIILNLLSNAIKFTTKGEIKIEIKLYDRIKSIDDNKVFILFKVSDTGIGIPKDKIDTIFEAFEKIDTFPASGTGLGLAICKQLVKNMGGDIWAESTLGRGSIFSFYLPLEKSMGTFETRVDLMNLNKKTIPTSNKSILLVEDNPVNRKILFYMLTNVGYEVTVAENGISCLNILQNKNFDLIIMDMQMPILDGYETCKRIRNEYKNNTPILALTAFSMEGDKEKCRLAGCDYYLAKPVSSQQLYEKLDQIFNESSDSANIEEKNRQFIKNLIPEFLNNLGNLMTSMKTSIETNNTKELASIAHDIKGTAGLYGFHHLSNLAAEIRKAALEPNISRIHEIYQNMLENIEQIKMLL
ncbi:PAS domain S-box protein [Thermosyntropha sp.]|uniref:PAS domain-containing sensor histidine kinase n=1 Tax=Thermosyntropha sp. TaxID=2740820 RepID=UPI0025E9E25B|nr:PAS domain S-box protein [Thermosyntropha sp.]MBO8158489.1 PAS domain S-box protein [Thermosyntropha sp.]